MFNLSFRQLILSLIPTIILISSCKSSTKSIVQGDSVPALEVNKSDISFNWFRKTICEKRTSTVEGALSLLPKSFRKNYTLMRESRSLQGASPDFPRAIVFGEDASFILSFNGSPSQKGYDAIEVSQFNRLTSEFEFREITFPSKANGLTAPLTTKVNPVVCLTCHGGSPRPNWESYSTWPGAYGGNDDTLIQSEALEYEHFLRSSKENDHPRYKFLERDDSDSLSPYGETVTGMFFSHRPNLKLLMLLMRQNSVKLAARISQYPELLQKIIVYLGSSCDMKSLASNARINGIFSSINSSHTFIAPINYTQPNYFHLLEFLGISPQQYTTGFLAQEYYFNTSKLNLMLANYLTAAILSNWRGHEGQKYENAYDVFSFVHYVGNQSNEDEEDMLFAGVLDDLLKPTIDYTGSKPTNFCRLVADEIFLHSDDEIKTAILEHEKSFMDSNSGENKTIPLTSSDDEDGIEPLCAL